MRSLTAIIFAIAWLWMGGGIAHAQTTEASPSTRVRVVEPTPQSTIASTANIHRVSAAKTPSGFPVPRYVSLKPNKANGRVGPSENHRILWQYRRKGLPVIVVAETELWRKIRDINGDEAWVYHSLLSGVRRAIVMDTVDIMRKPKSDARIIAVAETNALLRLEQCANGWCAVSTDGGYKGYVPAATLWGAAPLY